MRAECVGGIRMDVCKFVKSIGSSFYTGVPDSQLKALCDYLVDTYGIDPKHHIIAANEGNCAALAAGYYLATGKVPVVYMQNSGEGNIINPVASLLMIMYMQFHVFLLLVGEENQEFMMSRSIFIREQSH